MKIRITVQKEKKKREASKKERKRLVIGMDGFGERGLCRMDNTTLSTFWRPILTASI